MTETLSQSQSTCLFVYFLPVKIFVCPPPSSSPRLDINPHWLCTKIISYCSVAMGKNYSGKISSLTWNVQAQNLIGNCIASCLDKIKYFTSALTPDGGLINGVRELSQGKCLNVSFLLGVASHF